MGKKHLTASQPRPFTTGPRVNRLASGRSASKGKCLGLASVLFDSTVILPLSTEPLRSREGSVTLCGIRSARYDGCTGTGTRLDVVKVQCV